MADYTAAYLGYIVLDRPRQPSGFWKGNMRLCRMSGRPLRGHPKGLLRAESSCSKTARFSLSITSS